MRCEIITYDHSENGVSVFVVPETDAERAFLRGMWEHGKLKTCNGIADNSGQGFAVEWTLGGDA